MSTRTTALVGTLALIALLAGLTIDVLLREGVDVLVVVSLVIVAMLGYGVFGALLSRPEE